MTNEEWTHRILEHRTAVSDTIAFTYSEAPNSCFSPDRGMFYTAYSASRRNYGESQDILALGIIPVCQPHRARTIIVAERGVTPGAENAEMLICPNSYYWTDGEVLYNAKTHFGRRADILHGYVRVTVSIDGRKHCYADYDIANDAIGELKPLKVAWHGKIHHFTSDIFRSYLAEHGFHDFNKEESGEELILTDKFRLQCDGFRYTLATAAWAWPAVMRIKDGSDVMEFVGVIPQCAQYEAQSAVVDGKMYAILRGAKTDDFFISDDMGRSFRPVGRIDFNTTRPQLCPYKDRLLIAVSKKNIQPNRVRDGRNNLLLLSGKGDDLSQYRQVFHVTDPLGMVYYDLQDYKDSLYMLWSSADLYADKNPQAKDLLWFVRLGEL